MEDVAVAISSIDMGVIIGYFIVTLAIGIWVAKKTETGDDLFLAGRSLTWPIIGFSLFASNISSTTLIGLAGAAYSSGISVSTYEWMSGVPLILLAFIFAPLFLKSKITTIPEFLEKRFDRRSRVYFSIMTIGLSIVVDTAGGLYAGSVVLKTFFPDLIVWQVCLGLGLFAGLYTAAGGLKAVVYTDVLQAIVLIFGTTLLMFIMFQELDYSWDSVVNAVPSGHLSMIRPLDDPQLPWLGIITGVSMLGFWYWVTNQYIVQRVLGAKSLEHAQKGAILAGILKVIPLFTMVLPGAMAIVLLPDLPNADMVFPTMVTKILPVGIVGLVLAGLIAAIMSSVDSTLNSASTLVVHDFIKAKIEKNGGTMTSKDAAKYGKITTIVLMGLAIAWAPQIANFGGLWAYIQQAFGILVPPVAGIFLVGAFWKRGNGQGAFMSLVIGHAIGVVLFILGQLGLWKLHFTMNVGLMVAISVIVFVVVSLQTDAPDEAQVNETTWAPDMAIARDENGNPSYPAAKLHTILLILAMVGVVVGFW